MIPAKDFFKYYQTNFFKYQQKINKEVLEKIDYWVNKLDDEGECTENQVMQIIKSHIRITYLHCIDTLFELIFGLYPRENIIDDLKLPLILGRNNDNFNKPRIIGFTNKKEETYKEILQEIDYGNNKTSLIQYIFYYQINKSNIETSHFIKNIEESINPILELITIFARDLNDKSEYNSLKHGLRAYPFSGFFKIQNPSTKQDIAGIEFNNAHQYIIDTKENIKIVSKNFDSERDYHYTIVASRMIWNIIKIRHTFMNNKSGWENCYVYLFNQNDYKEIEKSLIHKQKFELKINKNMP